jgi:hypothetical protein
MVCNMDFSLAARKAYRRGLFEAPDDRPVATVAADRITHRHEQPIDRMPVPLGNALAAAR